MIERLLWAPGIQPGSTHHTITKHDDPFQILAHVSNILFLLNTVAESCRTYTCTAENRHFFSRSISKWNCSDTKVSLVLTLLKVIRNLHLDLICFH